MPNNDLDAILSHGKMETLSSKDVCEIIKTAKKHDIAEMEFGSLKLTFRKPEDTRTDKQIVVEYSGEKQIPEELQKKLYLDETIRLREAQLEAAKVTDPELYETLLLQGELSGEDENDDSGSQSDL